MYSQSIAHFDSPIIMNKPTPINSLPPEILIRIFHIVVAYPRNLCPDLACSKQYYPKYPDYLAQVCTLWRGIAHSTSTLWCRVDLSPNKPYCDKLTTRAQAHLAHAGQLPIELRIAVNGIDHRNLECDEVLRLISLISSRVESLELAMAGSLRHFHRGVFRFLFGQRPVLTKFVLLHHSYPCDSFLVANSFVSTDGEDLYSKYMRLNSTEDEMESSFAQLTVFHTRGIFPLWSSKAYHGLVDLRLWTDTSLHIREAELVTILKSSPGLRILHFELNMHDSTPVAEEVTPVELRDLQVIRIIPNDGGPLEPRPGSVLRLLAPGTKPLRLTLEGFYIQDAEMVTDPERFFARSRVTRFYTQMVLPPLNLLLRHSASLEQVVVDYFKSSSHSQLSSNSTGLQLELDEPASLPRLKSLHVTSRYVRSLSNCQDH
ncbi:hypothetical protein ACGC1H_000267 [Rhizoctonia solani]